MNHTDYQPHRQDQPPRRCAVEGCEVLLSSANGTKQCWAHGGWVELVGWWQATEDLADLLAEEPVAA